MISEFGSCRITGEMSGMTPAEWAKDALDAICSGRWPEVRGFSWWNEKWENGKNEEDTEMRVQVLDALGKTFQVQLEKYKDRLIEAPIVG